MLMFILIKKFNLSIKNKFTKKNCKNQNLYIYLMKIKNYDQNENNQHLKGKFYLQKVL